MENTGSGDNSTGEGGSGAEFPSSRGETFHIYVLSFAYGILVVSLVWVSGKPEISFVFFFLYVPNQSGSIWRKQNGILLSGDAKELVFSQDSLLGICTCRNV